VPLWRSTGGGSFVRDRPHSEHGTGSVETDSLQRADQTDPVVNTDDSDGPHLSIDGSSGQVLAPMTVSALSSPDIGEGGPMMINISNFTTAKILGKRSSLFGVDHRCEFGAGVVVLGLGRKDEDERRPGHMRSVSRCIVHCRKLALHSSMD
jgi:hypothetical protein